MSGLERPQARATQMRVVTTIVSTVNPSTLEVDHLIEVDYDEDTMTPAFARATAESAARSVIGSVNADIAEVRAEERERIAVAIRETDEVGS